MSYVRLVDWEPRLRAYVEAQRFVPFEYGHNDCALFVAGGINAVTGRDPAALLRGTYGGEDGAEIVLRRLEGLQAAASSVLGAPVDPKRCGRGDVVLFYHAKGAALGLVTGGNFAAPTRRGLIFISLRKASLGWEIPYE